MIEVVLHGGDMKRFYQSFCGLMFLLMASVNAQDSSLLNFPEKDFATPEAAVRHFAESIAKNDLEGALQAFAINDYADKFDFTTISERMEVIVPDQFLAPSDYAMYKQLNRLQLAWKYGEQIKIFAYSFYSSELLDETTVVQDEPERVSDFIESVNPERLANLKIAKMFKIIGVSERMLNMWEQQAKPAGADEITECVVLYELEGNYYLGGARVLRYGESWKLEGLSSIVAMTGYLGATKKMTTEEFEIFVSELGNNHNWRVVEIQ
jgi:hypothetical protein